MSSCRTIDKEDKSDSEKNAKTSGIFTLGANSVPEFGITVVKSQFSSVSHESTSSKKNFSKDKPKKEEKRIENENTIPVKDQKMSSSNVKRAFSGIRRSERELRRFKAMYNTSVGNILRDWMSVIYCILVLRMHLIKFLVRKSPDYNHEDYHFPKQMLLESKIIYHMIRNAQNVSQEQFVHMWKEVEKLINNRSILRSALEMIQIKESMSRDWKGADLKLAQMRKEYQEAQSEYKAVKKGKIEAEKLIQDNCSKLQELACMKDAKYEDLVEQITELKKKEVQTRGRILLNMKSYKNLKMKRQNLLNVENEMYQLKIEQNELVKDYTAKIQSLKNKIEEREKQIKLEKEEKKKIKASLEGFGDFSEKRSAIAINVG